MYWTIIEIDYLSLSYRLITFSPPFRVCYVDNCGTSCSILCDLLLFNSDQEPCHAKNLLRAKLIFSSEIWESHAETQQWALKMVSKGFRCSDKPIQVRNKGCTLTKQQQSPIKRFTIVNW